MIYDLPPLPEPYHGFYAAPMFTADQMRAYALAALDALADEAEASIKAMIEEGLGQVQPVAWQAVGGSIWGHKTSEDDRPLYTAPGGAMIYHFPLPELYGRIGFHDVYTADQMRAHAQARWNEGYKHGLWQGQSCAQPVPGAPVACPMCAERQQQRADNG